MIRKRNDSYLGHGVFAATNSRSISEEGVLVVVDVHVGVVEQVDDHVGVEAAVDVADYGLVLGATSQSHQQLLSLYSIPEPSKHY